MLAGNPEFVRRHPVATKRAMRPILKATDLCASDLGGAARLLVDGGFTPRYDYALQTLKDVRYDVWREYDAEDAIRFYALRMREAGFIKSSPQKRSQAIAALSITRQSIQLHRLVSQFNYIADTAIRAGSREVKYVLCKVPKHKTDRLVAEPRRRANGHGQILLIDIIPRRAHVAP